MSGLEKDFEVNVENTTQKERENEYVVKMKGVSKAGSGILKYVYAVMGYSAVFREVKPKKDKVARLEKEYQDSSRELKGITNQVAKIEAQLADLASRLETQLAEKTKLEQETAIMERRLIAADKLINGLSSENKRFFNLILTCT